MNNINSTYLCKLNDREYQTVKTLLKYTDIYATESYKRITLIDIIRNIIIYDSRKERLSSFNLPQENYIIKKDLERTSYVFKKLNNIFQNTGETPYISFNVRTTRDNGNRLLHYHVLPIEYTIEGLPWILMCTVSPSSKKQSGNYILHLKHSTRTFKFDFVSNEWSEQQPIRLLEAEKEIIQLSCQGQTTKTTADILNKSTDTVKVYKKQAFRKLDVNSIAEAIMFCFNHNLI